MAVWDRFPEGEVMNLLVNFFEGCNEGIMSKETGGRGSTVKWGKTLLEQGGGGGGGGGGGVCENPVRFSLNDGPMEIVECMYVNILCMLDWIIGFCHKTAAINFLGITCSTFSLFTFQLENNSLCTCQTIIRK